MKKLLKNNIKLIVGIIVGAILSGFTVYGATIIFQGDQVGFDNTNAGITLNNQSVDNVQDAIDAIYTKVNTDLNTCQADLATAQSQITPTCYNSPFQLGDYIDMTPTSTSFTPDRTLTGLDDYDTFKGNAAGTTTVVGTLNPSELSVWRVIKINPDCTVEVVSEYVSRVCVKFASKVGYQNYIYYLNEIAKQYANTTYTLDPSNANTPDGAFRNVGYDGQTKQITNTTRLDDTTLGARGGLWNNKSTPLNGEESLGGGDFGFLKDLNLIHEAGVSELAYTYNTTTPTSYWLASRLFYWYSTSNWYFYARVTDGNGGIGSSYLWYLGGSSFYTASTSYAVRPIVTLKSNITHSSGSGTSSSHYTLSAS